MKKLPLGIQTFSDIRDKAENYLYIDKTAIALRLINEGKYYFLSRPRRFGKSLFLDTLKEIFAGRQKLFAGLYIHDQWDWNNRYPVIHLSFGMGVIKDVDDLDVRIFAILKENQKRLQLSCEYTDNSRECFKELITLAYEKYGQKVVVLVDEYDKPILDNITNKALAGEIRDAMKNLYSVLKDSDAYLKFVFLTGVSKFSKVSLFSGLNNLEDISLDARYAAICGYTHQDVLTHFTDRLHGVDVEELKQWYNGYHFLGEGVYNPYDILLFFIKGNIYGNYWFETGNPSFLIEVLQQKQYYLPKLENIEINDAELSSFDLDYIKLETLLFQTGYLTIKKVRTVFSRRVYQLGYPNLEVRSALNEHLFEYLLTHSSIKRNTLFDSIIDNDMSLFERAIHQLFAAIPYNNYVKNTIQTYEGYYASVMYSYFAGLGLPFIAEDVTNTGRIDITITTPDKKQVYVIEFKVLDETTQTGCALKQIKEKKYYEKYQESADKLYLVGMEFSKKKRNLACFEWELL